MILDSCVPKEPLAETTCTATASSELMALQLQLASSNCQDRCISTGWENHTQVFPRHKCLHPDFLRTSALPVCHWWLFSSSIPRDTAIHARQTRSNDLSDEKEMWRAERDGVHLLFFVLVISNQGLKHVKQVNGGPNHKMALPLFQSPIQVFLGELAHWRERERERGETHYQCQEQETREDSREYNPNPLQKPTIPSPPSARTRSGEHPRGKKQEGEKEAQKDQLTKQKGGIFVSPRHRRSQTKARSSGPSQAYSSRDFFDLRLRFFFL